MSFLNILDILINVLLREYRPVLSRSLLLLNHSFNFFPTFINLSFIPFFQPSFRNFSHKLEAFLVRWSPDVSASIFLLYSQTIPILIASLASIGRNTLTLFDAHYSAAVTLSPVSVYVAACCILHRCGVETSLFHKIASSEAQVIILWLGLALPLLWLAVSVTTSFSVTAYTNSRFCENMSVSRYIA